jgi:hypothetical protein
MLERAKRFTGAGLAKAQLPAFLPLVLGMGIWSSLAYASDSSTETNATPPESAQELAKERHNPFADQITVPFELSSSIDVGPGNGTAGGFNVQPAIPVELTQDWRIILRPSLGVLVSEQPERKFGLSDLEFQTYVTPARVGKWIWGAGPDLQVPTATRPDLGTGKWEAGPAAGLIYMSGPWVNGILATHLWSFAGESGRASVSQSTIESVISYNFPSGWFLSWDSAMTCDWNAPAGHRWTIPVGLDAGKAFELFKQSVSLSFGTYYNIERAEGASQWLVRVQFAFVFPKHGG